MEQENQNQPGNIPPASAHFGSMPNHSESVRTVPKASETFGNIPNASEAFRNFPQGSERREYCTLTVRESARMFEAAGVARTERSIINWCQPNRAGVCRLESYFDPNERKYFLSPQSVELVIAEEKAKAAKMHDSTELIGTLPKDSEISERVPNASEAFRSVPQGSEKSPKLAEGSENNDRLQELEKQVLDLQITNRGKDFFIEQLRKERDGFVDQLLQASRQVGELQTKLLQLEAPHDSV